jgi:hypothetical protein
LPNGVRHGLYLTGNPINHFFHLSISSREG